VAGLRSVVLDTEPARPAHRATHWSALRVVTVPRLRSGFDVRSDLWRVCVLLERMWSSASSVQRQIQTVDTYASTFRRETAQMHGTQVVLLTTTTANTYVHDKSQLLLTIITTKTKLQLFFLELKLVKKQ